MTIETKYNIGNKMKYNIGVAVWVMMDNKVHHLRIEAIEVSIGKAMVGEDGILSISEYKYRYSVGWNNWYDESQLFPTKEELLKSL